MVLKHGRIEVLQTLITTLIAVITCHNFKFVAVQDDALYPTLTIRETLMFSARLRLPGTMSFREKQERVNSLIKMLSLTTCADTRVGDQKVLQQTPMSGFPISVKNSYKFT